MTDQEKQELFDELLQQIKSESQDIAALEEVSSLTGVKSLPAMRGTQLVTAPISLLSQAAMEGASLTLDLAELDAITSALKAERAYGKPALCGFIKQGDITIGTFACYASGGNTGYVQRLMSNYIINADGTITGSEIATSGRQQTHIAERVYRGGAWTLWREIASANEASDKYYKPTRIEKIADYAYHIWYGGVDYADAAEYFRGNYEAAVGACSAIWKDGILSRNYDWYYSNNAGFFVHTPAVNGSHAVNGFAGYLKGLTMAVVDSGEWNDKYRILPYLMTDGMNDAGLTAAVLVCENKDVTPTAQNTGKKKMNGLFVVRYVLDNHTDALAAAQDIANNYDVYMPHTDTVNEELHFIIGDKEKCVILEFVDNETKIIQDHNFVTNFKLYGTTPHGGLAVDYTTVHPYGQGVERFNVIAGIYNSKFGLPTLFALKYTGAYAGIIEDARRTEFTGIENNLTVQAAFDTPEIYDGILAAARTAYLERNRDEEKTWQTCHSVIFDSNTKKINFFVQEDLHQNWTYDTTSPGLEDEIAAREAADAALWAAVNDKVDKVAGKGLSTNDYTYEEKLKVANAATLDQAKGIGVMANQYTAKRINLVGENVLGQLNALLNGIGETTELNQELNGILAIGLGGFTMSVHNIQLNASNQKYVQIAITPLGISGDGQSLDWGIENSNECVLVRHRDANGWKSWQPLHQEIVGKLGDLTTTDKSSIVAAINEINDSQEELLFKFNYDEETYPLLQPTAYDAETGYFTCESMPSWIDDGVMANVHIHDKYKWEKTPYVYPRGADGMGEAFIRVVDTTHFYVEWGDISSSIPADVDCTRFAFCYFSYDFKRVICPLDGRMAGSDYYRIEWENLNNFPSKYIGCIGFSINNADKYYNFIRAFFCQAFSYKRRHVIACRGSMIIRIDKVPNGNYYDVSVNLISGSQESMYRESKTSTTINTGVTVLDKNKLNIWGGYSSDVVLTSLPLTPASEVRVYKLNNKLFEK